MTTISIIAAIDEAGGLGWNNQLLCHLPADLSHFKKITMGKPIIMGRATFESIGRPLPGRLNIVLSRSANDINGVTLVDSLAKALTQSPEAEEIMVIGGAQIYKQAFELADRLYITHIHHQFQADAYFPSIDEDQWICQSSEFRAKDETNLYDLTFKVYHKK